MGRLSGKVAIITVRPAGRSRGKVVCGRGRAGRDYRRTGTRPAGRSRTRRRRLLSSPRRIRQRCLGEGRVGNACGVLANSTPSSITQGCSIQRRLSTPAWPTWNSIPGEPAWCVSRHEVRDRTLAGVKGRFNRQHLFGLGDARQPGQFAYAAANGRTRNDGNAASNSRGLGISVNAVYQDHQNADDRGNSDETNAHFTQYIPLGRIGEANEVAELVVSRFGPASYITAPRSRPTAVRACRQLGKPRGRSAS